MTLGIVNRTENWKTAQSLSPLFGDRAVFLAHKLGEAQTTPAPDVTLELFWTGARDYCFGKDKRECAEQLVSSCRRLFPKLRDKIKTFDGFNDLQPHNYNISSEDQRQQLLNNLLNTEIDIIIKSPERLYIGEAKYASGFHADGKLVLVHQLVRQYVMANVLVDVTGSKLKVVPFVITEEREKRREPDQIRFMMHREWMEPDHRLTWDQIDALASKPPDGGCG